MQATYVTVVLCRCFFTFTKMDTDRCARVQYSNDKGLQKHICLFCTCKRCSFQKNSPARHTSHTYI